MKAEIITVGDEICRGEIVNTNASWLAGHLWDRQITVTHIVTCRDVREDILHAIEEACRRSELVMMSGGLGPTIDDLGVDVACELLGCAPVIHGPSEERVRTLFSQLGREVDEAVLRQARCPEKSIPFTNPVGLAPGFAFTHKKTQIFCLPGPPRELKGLVLGAIGARLSEVQGESEGREFIARRIFKIFGRAESQVAKALEGLRLPEGASLHYQVKFPEVFAKVVVRNKLQDEADRILGEIDAEVRERVGPALYGQDEATLAATLVAELREAGLQVASAESCTGGRIGGLITEVPGSSAVYLGGGITYSNEEKVRQLGVKEETLIEHGAVSEETVREMARGICERTGAHLGVSVSGVAGPDGGTPEKPVGTVWLAVAGPGTGEPRTKLLRLPAPRDSAGDDTSKRDARERIRTIASFWALRLLREQLHSASVGEES